MSVHDGSRLHGPATVGRQHLKAGVLERVLVPGDRRRRAETAWGGGGAGAVGGGAPAAAAAAAYGSGSGSGSDVINSSLARRRRQLAALIPRRPCVLGSLSANSTIADAQTDGRGDKGRREEKTNHVHDERRRRLRALARCTGPRRSCCAELAVAVVGVPLLCRFADSQDIARFWLRRAASFAVAFKCTRSRLILKANYSGQKRCQTWLKPLVVGRQHAPSEQITEM